MFWKKKEKINENPLEHLDRYCEKNSYEIKYFYGYSEAKHQALRSNDNLNGFSIQKTINDKPLYYLADLEHNGGQIFSYCGVYSENILDLPHFEMTVRVKNKLDNVIKPVSTKFAPKLIIESNDNKFAQEILNKELCNILESLISDEKAIYFSVNKRELTFSRKVKGHSFIGLEIRYQWISDEQKIEQLFIAMENILKEIENN